MATIRKGGKGWQALIRRKGYSGPKSRTFATRKEAEIWARATEEQLTPKRPDQPAVPLTLADAIESFIDAPLKSHRSNANELYPLRASARSQLGSVLLSELTIRHLAIWRDQRPTAVKANTVMRELRVLRVLLDWARDERGANLNGNPARKLKAKAGNDASVAFLSRENEKQLIKALNRRKKPDNAFLVQLAHHSHEVIRATRAPLGRHRLRAPGCPPPSQGLRDNRETTIPSPYSSQRGDYSAPGRKERQSRLGHSDNRLQRPLSI